MVHSAHTWANGDTITATLLNSIEQDLAAAGIASVVANALSAGASPTASISGNVLTLGLPAGAAGGQGIAGTAGAAALMTIGTITTLAAGAAATATVTGSAPNFVLNLGIPQGAAGSGGAGAAVLQFQPSTAYTAGQIVINPAGQVVQAITGFTSAATYSATNWTVLSIILLAPNTVTSAGTMVAGKPNFLDATSGAFTATLPTPAFVGQEIEFERVDTTSNLITIGGTVRGVASQITLLGNGVAGESFALYAESLTSWRVASSHKPNALLTTLYQARFQPNTAYASGAIVVNPAGVLVSANTGFTSGSSYSASNWTATTAAGGGVTPVSSTADPTVTSDSTANIVVGQTWVNTTSGATFTCLANTPGAAVWKRNSPDVQTFSPAGSYTWTKPAWCTSVSVQMVGAGGGGGSGRRGPSGTAQGGGGGGGGAGYSNVLLAAASLGSSATVLVGAGGTGGPSQTTDATNGTAGGAGGATSFGAFVRVLGAAGGGAGSTAAGAAGTASTGMTVAGTIAGAGGFGGSGGDAAGNNFLGATGGGGGGGTTAAPANSIGGGGGNTQASNFTGGGSRGAAASAGGNATSIGVVAAIGGTGGGGGGSGTTTAGGNGGTPAGPGAGGGGGGSSLNGFASGAGAAGSDGIVVVISW